MNAHIPTYILSVFVIIFSSVIVQYARTQTFGQAELVNEWKWLEIDWPSEEEKQNAIANGSFVPERNLMSAIKIYKDEMYISIPRRKWTSGSPVSLAKVVTVRGQTKLRPYPNWAAQKQGDCKSLQFVQGMEVDPNTGLMYVIDTGRVALSLNLCPAKIVIYDLNTDQQVELHELPNDVVNRSSNFLNDLVLDYVEGKVRYAYITDTNGRSIVVYDLWKRSAYKVQDQSMNIESGNASVITINGKNFNFPIAVNGIAMSPDFKYVYYCVLGGYSVFQVPTSTLRDPESAPKTGIRNIGRKVSQSDGIAHGRELLYYGAIGLNAIYYWNSTKDMSDGKFDIDNVNMRTQIELIRDDKKMQWPNSFAFDEKGWIWIACTRLQDFGNTEHPSDDDEAFMNIWKIYVNETSYLYQADRRTQGNSGQFLSPLTAKTTSGIFLCVLISLTYFRLSPILIN